MRTRRLGLALVPAAALIALAGCGSATSTSSLGPGQVPMLPGSTVITQSKQCDRGSNAYCAVEAVVVNHRYTSSGAFVAGQDRLLKRLGWRSNAGDDGDEVARNSPNQKLRLTFATAMDDLIAIDEGWIKRSWPIEWTLHQTMFDRTPAMSIMLEAGPT